MTESEVYKKMVSPLLIREGVFFFRVESKRLPDIYTAKNDNILWIELKCSKEPYHSEVIKPDWRPGQLAWIKENKRFGNRNSICLCLYDYGKLYFLPPKESYIRKQLACQREFYFNIYK